ncbi:hypothetical protein Q9L58_007182 [Maublancomyces gigas]|uniref:Uncharacterized protein n=1 Tax=Discina gigas TaxID=1032678 RepID=A0ABR3GDL6_9PEZI
MSLLQRSTRSAPDPVLQSLPKKSRKPRVAGAAPATHSPGPTRARWESGNDDSMSGDGPADPTRTLAAGESDIEAEVLFPRRKKRAPLPAKRDAVVSPNTKDKLRRLSAKTSVLGASMGMTTPRKSLPSKKTFSIARKEPSKYPGVDTQDVIVVATPRAGVKRTRANSIDSSDFEEESTTTSMPGRKALRKNINAHNAADPPSAVKDSAPRRKKAKMKSAGEHPVDEGSHMDKLMMVAIRNPSTPGDESLDYSLSPMEDLEGAVQKVVGAESAHDRQTPAKRMKKKEKQKALDEKNMRKRAEKEKALEEGRRGEDSSGKGDERGHAERNTHRGDTARNGYANFSKPPNKTRGMANVALGAYYDDDDDEEEEEEDADNLAYCLELIQKMADKYGTTSITFDTLTKDFCDLKALQTPPPRGETGYYGLIGKLTVPLLANTGARISTHERVTLRELTGVMHSLADFHRSAKDFEYKLRRLVRMNLTQLRNIEKAQRAIKNVFDARRYKGDGTVWRVGEVWVGDDPAQEVAREANREAVRKRNEEIERVLVQRERAMYGYQTPDSVGEHQGKGRRVRSVGGTDEGRDQRGIGVGEESQSMNEQSDDDEGIRVDSGGFDEDQDQSIRMGGVVSSEEADEERSDEEPSDEEQTEEEHNHSDNVESEGSQGTHADEKSGYGRGNYGYSSSEQYGVGSSEGREGSSIVIGDDVEVVQVEGFGERAAKERARVEREARRGNGESDDEVSVLEDREWTEEEIDALLFGIEAYQGKFHQIKRSADYSEQLRNRSVEAIAEKARDIKRDFIESGRVDVLGHCWDRV